MPTAIEERVISGINPIHPGAYLAEMLEEFGITADTALRIGKAPDMSPGYWLNLQRMYYLDVARAATDVGSVRPPVG